MNDIILKQIKSGVARASDVMSNFNTLKNAILNIGTETTKQITSAATGIKKYTNNITFSIGDWVYVNSPYTSIYRAKQDGIQGIQPPNTEYWEEVGLSYIGNQLLDIKWSDKKINNSNWQLSDGQYHDSTIVYNYLNSLYNDADKKTIKYDYYGYKPYRQAVFKSNTDRFCEANTGVMTISCTSEYSKDNAISMAFNEKSDEWSVKSGVGSADIVITFGSKIRLKSITHVQRDGTGKKLASKCTIINGTGEVISNITDLSSNSLGVTNIPVNNEKGYVDVETITLRLTGSSASKAYWGAREFVINAEFGGYDIPYIVCKNGYKMIYNDMPIFINDKFEWVNDEVNTNVITLLNTIYSEYGMAYYYILNKKDATYILPRTKWFLQFSDNNIGYANQSGLPSIDLLLRMDGGETVSKFFYDDTYSDVDYLKQYSNNDIGGAVRRASDSSDEYMFNQSKTYMNSCKAGDLLLDKTIYGDSTFVQPPSVNGYLYFYIGSDSLASTVLDNKITTIENIIEDFQEIKEDVETKLEQSHEEISQALQIANGQYGDKIQNLEETTYGIKPYSIKEFYYTDEIELPSGYLFDENQEETEILATYTDGVTVPQPNDVILIDNIYYVYDGSSWHKSELTIEDINASGSEGLVEKVENLEVNIPSTYATKVELADVETIALGKVKSYVFDTVEEMNVFIDSDSEHLKTGDTLYIRATDVPDYWWDGTQAQILETQKVILPTKISDLTDDVGMTNVINNAVNLVSRTELATTLTGFYTKDDIDNIFGDMESLLDDVIGGSN